MRVGVRVRVRVGVGVRVGVRVSVTFLSASVRCAHSMAKGAPG